MIFSYKDLYDKKQIELQKSAEKKKIEDDIKRKEQLKKKREEKENASRFDADSHGTLFMNKIKIHIYLN